jgi:long-chain acyl-CoA synthetase
VLTVADPLEHARLVGVDRVAVVCGDERFTYRELYDRCRRLAGGLRALRLTTGDRVAVVADNCHRYLELYLAVPAAGFVVVPLNARHTEAELRYALEDSGARVLATDRDPGALAGIVDRVLSLPGDYDKLIGQGFDAPLGQDVTEDSLAGLFYTGGTTGASKGVMASHRNLVANSFNIVVLLGLTGDDRWLIMAPMFHAAGTCAVLANVWVGAAHVITPFDPPTVLDLMQSEAITSVLGVPTMVAAVAEEQAARPREVGSVRLFVHGGSPMATDVLRRARDAFATTEFIEIYGATETWFATAQRHKERMLDSPLVKSCGKPIAGASVRVINLTSGVASHGEIGEILVRGPSVMQGYWNKPVQTAEAFVEGWYRTGDLGYQDAAANVFLVDRAKDMIISGGENVYSTEVEDALYSHPMVLEAAVFAVPDERWGERVHAAVVLRGPATRDELVAHCRARIAAYKVPRTIDLTNELPKSASGKILKSELRKPYWDGRTTSIA